ncbi:MAG: beta-lactamase family protein [Myxococcales bacterium]|nr:beta-lactamase family protein [Myxococcales bacterium]
MGERLKQLERLAHIGDMRPRLVRKVDPDDVTTISTREGDPRDVGLTERDIDAIWGAVRRLYKTRLHPAIALCLRRRGEVLIDRAVGHARGNSPDDDEGAVQVPATPDTLYNMFSASKCVTAMLIHLLQERGKLHVDEPVATFIPEFAKHRKHRITVRDVLTHRSGIPAVPVEVLDLDLLARWDDIIALTCDLEPVLRAGGETAYHALTGGFILGEIVRRVDGRDVRRFLGEEVSQPLGFAHFNYGVPPERLGDVALEAFTGPPSVGPPKDLLERALGMNMPELVDAANDPRFRTGIVPAGNVIGTPDDVCRYFELLLSGGVLDGKRIFEQRTVARAVEEQARGQIDRTIFLPVPYSMGFMLGSDRFGFYGVHCGKAYGHLGFTNVLGWADPERDISVALMTTGKPFITPKLLVWLDVMRTISTRVPRDRVLP